MSNAIMEFGEILKKAKNFYALGQGPVFSWAAPGDVAICGEVPEDFDGRVCFVKVPDEKTPLCGRVYRDGANILLGYMDDYDVWKSYPTESVTILYEVLGVVHKYEREERPKPKDTWEKRTTKAMRAAAGKFTARDYDQLRKRHTSGHTWDTLAAAFSIGYQKGAATK